MAPLFLNRVENSFVRPNDTNHDPRLFPPISRSSQTRPCCSADAAPSSVAKQPWHEFALSSIESRQHGIRNSTSADMGCGSLSDTRFNKAQQERRRPARSPTPSCARFVNSLNMPSVIARDPRRKTSWLKARVQHERDRQRKQNRNREIDSTLVEAEEPALLMAISPERKQIAVVKQEVMKYSREDREGTPHSSELQPDDDMVTCCSVEELGMGGEAEILASAWYECSATTVADCGPDW